MYYKTQPGHTSMQQQNKDLQTLKHRNEIKYLWGTRRTRVNLVEHGDRYYNFCAKIKHVGQELQYTGPR